MNLVTENFFLNFLTPKKNLSLSRNFFTKIYNKLDCNFTNYLLHFFKLFARL